MSSTRFRASLIAPQVLIPLGHGRIPQGAWLYASCRPIAVAANIVNGLLTAIHPKLVPGRDADWGPPDPDLMEAIVGVLSDAHRSIAAYVVVRPTDPRRARFNLLAVDHRGRHVAFVKAVRSPLDTKHVNALETVSSHEHSFWAPRVVGAADINAWSFVVTSAMPAGPHGPAHLDSRSRRDLAEEIRQCLPPSDDPTLVPIHGDFGPWNVRRLWSGLIAVVDWEESALGPDSADEVWHAVTSHLVANATPEKVAGIVRSEMSSRCEAGARFWLERLERPEASEIDDAVDRPQHVATFERAIKSTLRLVLGTEPLPPR